MTASQYNALTFHEKANLLCKKGIYVETMNLEGLWVDLYSISSLFVEVYFNESTCQIESLKVVGHQELSKYLREITIGAVL
jgi:hypothetical protein